MSSLDKVYCGDCLEVMPTLKSNSVDLVFADPPFNTGYEYEEYIDNKTHSEFVEWCGRWMREINRVLKFNGTFWLAMGDKCVPDLAVLARDCGFGMRNWIIWSYGFGTYTEHKFTRCHGHLLYFVKNLDNYTFNTNAPNLRVPSDRQVKYRDKRANPLGKIPGSVWDVPRVAGTHKERTGWHPAQMPERILARIIRACSLPTDTVLDPFAGSGVSGVTAKKLGRHYQLIELTSSYCDKMTERLEHTRVGDPIHGEEHEDV